MVPVGLFFSVKVAEVYAGDGEVGEKQSGEVKLVNTITIWM